MLYMVSLLNSVRTVKYLTNNRFVLSMDCIVSSQSSFLFQEMFV